MPTHTVRCTRAVGMSGVGIAYQIAFFPFYLPALCCCFLGRTHQGPAQTRPPRSRTRASAAHRRKLRGRAGRTPPPRELSPAPSAEAGPETYTPVRAPGRQRITMEGKKTGTGTSPRTRTIQGTTAEGKERSAPQRSCRETSSSQKSWSPIIMSAQAAAATAALFLAGGYM